MKKTIVIAGTVGIVLLVTICGGILLTRNALLKSGIQKLAHDLLGVTVTIKNLHLGLTRSFLTIEGLTISNPEGFEEKPLATIPLLFIHYEPRSLITGSLYCTEVKATIDEITIIKNSQGDTNIAHLGLLSPGSKKPSIKSILGVGQGKPIAITIEKFILNLNKVTMYDYSRKGTPKERVISFGTAQVEFKNITSLEEIARIIFKTIKSSSEYNIGSITMYLTSSSPACGRQVFPPRKRTVSLSQVV